MNIQELYEITKNSIKEISNFIDSLLCLCIINNYYIEEGCIKGGCINA